MNRALKVLWDSDRVGTLRLDEHGDMVFSYERTWLEDPTKLAISASLPKQADPFGRRASRPFFAGLLPDEHQRAGAARVLGVSKGNDFALLDALGGDVAGALVLWPEGDDAPAPSKTDPRMLDDAELTSLLDELPRRPMLAGETKLRLSLAGAQPKLPVVLVKNQVALPALGQPTTHILKPALQDYPGTTENEAFCLRLAVAVRLSAAPVEPRRVGERTFVLVERYDRAKTDNATFRRIHQEDFCQALGIAPECKYASEGGPGFKASFDLVRRVCVRPAVDVLRLLDAAIFNVIIGNADAHGKNFSLLYRPTGPTLTPLYDLMATIIYPEISAKLAMKFAKMSAIENLDRRVWSKFASDIGVSGPFVLRRVPELCRKVVNSCPSVVQRIADEGFAGDMLDLIAATVQERALALGAMLDSGLSAKDAAAGKAA